MLRTQYETEFVKRRELISKYVWSGNDPATPCPEIDAGIDLFVPESISIDSSPSARTITVKHQLHCAMYFGDIPCGFHMYPRSSISKTPLRLANSVGIIDAGYRGDIMAKFDVHAYVSHEIPLYGRVVQLCAPNMTYPICPVMVDSMDALGRSTIRGSGGFGSTGR
jgi:dUTP pyrophosphatase